MTTTTLIPTANPDRHAATPALIMQIAHGFMASKHLFAASELGLFEALGEGPVDLNGLAARIGLTRRTVRISVDAMVALGLVHRSGDRYANSRETAMFLSGASPADLRPLLRFWDRLSYPAWADLAGALGRGRPLQQLFDIDSALVPIMSAGIEAATSSACQALPAAARLRPGSRLLDLGGGTGSWTIALAHADQTLTATVLELPEVTPIATERVRTSGLSERIDVRVGDLRDHNLPAGYDAFLLANVVHYFTPESNQSILRHIRPAVSPGAQLLLADFWTDSTHTEPLPAALMAGEFAVHLDDGDVYSVEEVTAWLAETGWRLTTHTTLAGPISLIKAEPA